MKKKDYIIITFFALIFIVVLYQRKIMPMMMQNSSSSSSTGSGSESGAESGESKDESNAQNKGTNKGQPRKESKSGLDSVFSEFEASLGLVDPSVEEDPDQEIKPPSGMNRTSYYENGKFKSSYSGTEVPAELLTKKEFFTDPRKMKEDINFKMDKMSWDMENERKEFARTHDIRGKDRDAWNKLQDDHRKMRRQMWDENHKTWEELKRETYDTKGSELR